jgi:hypothetical protein
VIFFTSVIVREGGRSSSGDDEEVSCSPDFASLHPGYLLILEGGEDCQQ